MKAKARSMTTIRNMLWTNLEPTEKEKREMHELVAALIMLAGATMILFGRYILVESFFLFLLTGLGFLAAGMYRFERIGWHEKNNWFSQDETVGRNSSSKSRLGLPLASRFQTSEQMI